MARASKTPPTIGELVEARLSRRHLLKAGMLGAGAAMLPGAALAGKRDGWFDRLIPSAGGGASPFREVEHAYTETIAVPDGYQAQVLMRWGDEVLKDAPAFDPAKQSPEAQAKQFGYNNDYIAFMPLGNGNSQHGLLCVNHEYTNTNLMFSGMSRHGAAEAISKAQAQTEMAAHGHSVVEIRQTAEGWQPVPQSRYNRRFNALNTRFALSGPVAGHPRAMTASDKTGREVTGTLNNCAGGKTPWGTVLFAEENFDDYFHGDAAGTSEARNYERYGVGSSGDMYGWWRFDDRFRLDREPNEANRFGWVVEYDPYEPASLPKKRTALGRFKHEGATTALTPDGRVVVYMGDDERFEYLYKFVSANTYDPENRAANRDLLDEGTLYTVRFEADGSVRWLPLIFGEGPLTEKEGFYSQADVLIETRRAAELVGATPMDRPEDVEANPASGKVYVSLTNNSKRMEANAVNPRTPNLYGHVLELTPPKQGEQADHGAEVYQWEIFLLAGKPDEGSGAAYGGAISEHGFLSCPDNVAFDPKGRLWIATDGLPKTYGVADGLFMTETEGAGRAIPRHFFRAPKGAEVCGPEFTPDGTTLFLAVQHPGADGSFDTPSTRWPDFDEAMPPRPSVIAITKEDGGVIGG